jgi:anti-anti-sigma factor
MPSLTVPPAAASPPIVSGERPGLKTGMTTREDTGTPPQPAIALPRNAVLSSDRSGEALHMDIVQDRAGEVVIVKLKGRLDSSAASDAEAGFAAALGDEPPHLAIDFTELDYISSAGLRVLLILARRVQQMQGKIALFGLLDNVREVFSVSGFDRIFAIAADRAAAIATIR